MKVYIVFEEESDHDFHCYDAIYVALSQEDAEGFVKSTFDVKLYDPEYDDIWVETDRSFKKRQKEQLIASQRTYKIEEYEVGVRKDYDE
jgi:hypothetical protein